jgi:hypothetical protein
MAMAKAMGMGMGMGMAKATAAATAAIRRPVPVAGALAAVAAFALLPLAPRPALAQASPLRNAEQAESNFVFAHRLGSGLYELSGRTLQIYRLPIEWRLRAPTPTRPGLTLTLPVTAGFFDFRVPDVIETGLPTNISTLSVVPGLRWDYRIDDAWRVAPFVEAGLARDNGADLQARVMTAGVRAEWLGETRWGDGRYVASFSYAYADPQQQPIDDFALLAHSVQLKQRLRARPRGHALQWLPYASLRWYADPPSTPLSANGLRGGTTARVQAELGFTFGTVVPLKVGRFDLPALGIGYRFGENLSVLRVVIGQPF